MMRQLVRLVMLCAPIFLAGCGADSLLPWLDGTTVSPCNRDWVGEWFVSESGGKSELRVVVEVKDVKVVANGERTLPEYYRIKVYDRKGDRAASLTAHLHTVNGIQLLQMQRFGSRTTDEISSVITFGLWRIEGDSDNLMLWVPEFVIDILKSENDQSLSIVRAGHELEQPIFVDSTENLRAFIEKWTKTYEEAQMKLPLVLHRKGKAFESPPGVKY